MPEYSTLSDTLAEPVILQPPAVKLPLSKSSLQGSAPCGGSVVAEAPDEAAPTFGVGVTESRIGTV